MTNIQEIVFGPIDFPIHTYCISKEKIYFPRILLIPFHLSQIFLFSFSGSCQARFQKVSLPSEKISNPVKRIILSAHSTRFYYRTCECAVIKAELESIGFPVIECENESHKSASIYLNPASIIIKIILFQNNHRRSDQNSQIY